MHLFRVLAVTRWCGDAFHLRSLWGMPTWFGRHLQEVCAGLASGRLQHKLGRQQGDCVLFRSYRVRCSGGEWEIVSPVAKLQPVWGSPVRPFSALFSLLQLCHREALLVMGVGMENSFSFAFINNHIEAWAMEILFLSTQRQNIILHISVHMTM